MELVYKVCLLASIEQLGAGQEISIPLAMFKETTTRVAAVKVAKKTGGRYSVSCTDDDCIVRRLC